MSELERVKAFALRKNEITVAAANEVDKLQRHLLFVSLKDYNKVLEENKKLKMLVMDWDTANPKAKEYINLDTVLKYTGMTEDEFLSYLKEHKVRTKVNGTYKYYNRQDLLKHLTGFKKDGIMK